MNTIKLNNYDMDGKIFFWNFHPIIFFLKKAKFYQELLLAGENIIIKIQNKKTSIKKDLHNLIFTDALALYLNKNPTEQELHLYYRFFFFFFLICLIF